MFKSLQSQSFMRDPVPVLDEMRRKGPLVQARMPMIGKVWFTTTQAAAAQVLKDGERFTVTKKDGKPVGLSWWMPRSLKLLASNMLATDNPDHQRLRGLVDQAFHRREIMNLGEGIRHNAEALSVELLARNRTTDLISGFARPFPLAVICELLGLPQDDRPKFTQWASGLTRVTGMLSFLFIILKLKPFVGYIESRISLAPEDGGEGLIKELVELKASGEDISNDELVAMVFLLLIAGHETTTHLISGGLLALFQHPEQLDRLKSDWSHLDLAVEEILRFVSPVMSTKPRFVREDCEIEGVSLPAGDVIMPLLIAANYDPDVFENPEKFDISRKPNRHMEFGSGMHFCLGHQLARLELKQALQTLLTDYPDLRLAIPEAEIEWNARFGLRSLKTLPVAR
ncbi:MAG: cytochrome P450 [Pseudomonadota bacterium]